MEIISALIQTLFQLDSQLTLIDQVGGWLYVALFVIVFFETGLIVLSIVPADSLLFAAGALAALGSLDLAGLVGLMCVATVLGDSANYVLGQQAGRRYLLDRTPFTRAQRLSRAETFFAQHGHKAIVVARFIPVVRPLTPVVAGMALMPFRRFLAFNLAGGFVWVSAFVFAGYYFGNVPLVRDNLALVLLGVVLVSVMPLLFEAARRRARSLRP